ncbi:hypothetical protein BD626DRAFT_475223 [Schizophyllum amplum]|uniref:Uncharacterized protein n=1 Tax=Schizophyllum amplum TaxID=97359 RepID=A0A550CYB8_9AGAR|nr:hypothetical protein BD626DRAFT_475223 [Auriculariopsis ampla]
MADNFTKLLVDRYPVYRAQYPQHGRRWRQQRILQEFWENPTRVIDVSMDAADAEDFSEDPDPYDFAVTDGPEAGVLIRTDFSDDAAFQSFCTELKEVERELLDSMKPDEPMPAPTVGPSTASDTPSAPPQSAEDEDDSSDDEGVLPSAIVRIVDPSTDARPSFREVFRDITNLTALRMLNEPGVRPAPPVPHGGKRIAQPNRLIERARLQEVYSGMTIWIYDQKSNTDRCARLVNQQGDVYGTATGDSWRARVTHIPELQFNMTYMGMQINFGGEDRYDYAERKRNLDEADNIPASL